MTTAHPPGSPATRRSELVSVADLAQELDDASPPLILDVRWRLGDEPGAGLARYQAGHLPGAIHADIDEVFSQPKLWATDGRHPLPDPDKLAQDLASLGVSPDRRVVVVDDPGTFAAERSWWVLRWAGMDARVLDGGVPAWKAADLPLDVGDHPPIPVPIVNLSVGQLPTVTADEAGQAGVTPGRTLIDARAAERYRGEAEPIDPVAGHIPGAVNIPVAEAFTADGRMPDQTALLELLQPQDHPDPVVYCGSGVSAAREVLAFAQLGIQAALFPGSWSAWCNDPFRPVARGIEARYQ